ncbi:hypothetical protein AADEFJLK_04703 [Methylovulum psychrotolerans]|uniref:Uncharacterized protein n=1 Tax=Methylovulum psychrotolerans TaxID=1704499 RepID=A0A2S5CFE7_9GAMM|nr:hypothetical protein AADEFJLK_04703 [Methylovulum psychrotolerans]
MAFSHCTIACRLLNAGLYTPQSLNLIAPSLVLALPVNAKPPLYMTIQKAPGKH